MWSEETVYMGLLQIAQKQWTFSWTQDFFKERMQVIFFITSGVQILPVMNTRNGWNFLVSSRYYIPEARYSNPTVPFCTSFQ